MKRKAVTLIELVVVITTIGFLTLGVSAYLIQAMDVWNFLSFRSDVVNEARRGLMRMGRDMRKLSVIEISNDDDCTFLIDIGGTETRVRYRYDAGNSEVLYEVDADDDGTFSAPEPSYVLLDGVSAFDFDYIDRNNVSTSTPADAYLIVIAVTLQNMNETMQLSYQVFPRSFKY
ncbi:MAG: hypothetical protein GY858_02165 [Candidatus Omnitrophica bacterium]|nr:hypothetical protein [Candidatus Omnitrophota bacterium]